MGLAGPKNRRKLQHDPNNTKWSRDETTFGQKILRAHGWEPGKFLGAQDSAHSHLHSSASAAPITVLLKDDNLGLGAKPRHKQNAECTGLDVFKDLLGRLNGKSEEVIEKEKEVRSQIKTNMYIERKYGTMRFVSGGLLVGDQIKDLLSKDVKPESPENIDDKKVATTSEGAVGRTLKKEKKEKKSKKRKAEEPESTDDIDTVRDRKRKKRSKDEGSQIGLTGSLEPEESRRKKSKKAKREDSSAIEPEKKKKTKDREREAETDGTPRVPEDSQAEKSKSKKEKKERRREKKGRKPKDSDTPTSSPDVPTPIVVATPQESGMSTPSGTGSSTPQPLSARHLARSRHIASKRMAMADLQALNQIFMVKPI
ncbi:hypothetical protein GGR54DRAFT_612228 [Hypoxylon sp. NC1633]|nr:hypothetical protein GGR54DRAFT_612228 [Hypoxylon sp. NC1633]